MCFHNERFKEVSERSKAKNNGAIKATECLKAIAEEWKQLTNEQK